MLLNERKIIDYKMVRYSYQLRVYYQPASINKVVVISNISKYRNLPATIYNNIEVFANHIFQYLYNIKSLVYNRENIVWIVHQLDSLSIDIKDEFYKIELEWNKQQNKYINPNYFNYSKQELEELVNEKWLKLQYNHTIII